MNEIKSEREQLEIALYELSQCQQRISELEEHVRCQEDLKQFDEKQIEELKAENERLKLIIAKIYPVLSADSWDKFKSENNL